MVFTVRGGAGGVEQAVSVQHELWGRPEGAQGWAQLGELCRGCGAWAGICPCQGHQLCPCPALAVPLGVPSSETAAQAQKGIKYNNNNKK